MKQIKIGVLVNTHGLKGEVKIKPLTDFPDIRFKIGNTIHMHHHDQDIALRIQYVRQQKDLLLVCFEGYEDINAVEGWKGNSLYINEDQLHELEEDEVYFFELMDCEVYDTNDTKLGVVKEVIETGANAVLRVCGEREYLIPYVKAFIKAYDKTEKTIHVELVEGL